MALLSRNGSENVGVFRGDSGQPVQLFVRTLISPFVIRIEASCE